MTKEGRPLEKAVSSNRQFVRQLYHGTFEEALFELLQNPENRQLFRMVLTDTFFPDSKQRIQSTLPTLFQEIEQQVLEEAPAKYRKKNN